MARDDAARAGGEDSADSGGGGGGAAAAPLTYLERQRLANVQRNQALLEQLQVIETLLIVARIEGGQR